MDLKTETPLILTLLTEKGHEISAALKSTDDSKSVKKKRSFKVATLNTKPLFDQGFASDLRDFATAVLDSSTQLSSTENDDSVRSHSEQIIKRNFDAANYFFVKKEFLEGNRYLVLACGRICKMMGLRNMAETYDALHSKIHALSNAQKVA